MLLSGAFLEAPPATAEDTLRKCYQRGVVVKVTTSDNRETAEKACLRIGMRGVVFESDVKLPDV
eukprot:4279819-Pyramimonas_sp.AAC.1